MAALTLVERGIPVTLLESGVDMPKGLYLRAAGASLYRKWPQFHMNGGHVASDDPEALWYHELAPGGLSNYWTGAVPRFAPEDFTEGERLHEQYRWPLTYEELRPYYEQVERVLVVTGDDRDVDHLPASHVAYTRRLPADWQRIAPYAHELGHGFTTVPLATGHRWLVSRTGAPFNSFTTIVRKLRGSPHFKLLLGAHALHLEWNGAKKKVDSVVYFDRTAKCERRLSAAAVVVAAGPLASTKLLLDSDSADFPEGLGNTEGVLGRYLHDHAHEWYLIELEQPLRRLGHTAYLTRADYATSEPLLGAGCVLGNATTRDKVLALAPTRTHQFGVATFGTTIPSERNWVGRHPTEKGEFGLPKLDLHIRFDDAVQRNMAHARERLVAVLESAGYRARIRGELPTFKPGGSVHFGGTIRMHDSPHYGMLNRWGRLHVVDNVVVADASCFTTGPEKNPTPTAMALAARAADCLASDLKAHVTPAVAVHGG
jgi:choline dehydrogenase-like flavoprotein